MINATDIQVKRMARRLEGNTGQYAGRRSVTVRRRRGGNRTMGQWFYSSKSDLDLLYSSPPGFPIHDDYPSVLLKCGNITRHTFPFLSGSSALLPSKRSFLS
jgi:hypothetical protein